MNASFLRIGAALLAVILAACVGPPGPDNRRDSHDPDNLQRAEPPKAWKADSPRLFTCAELQEVGDRYGRTIGYRIELKPYQWQGEAGKYYVSSKLIPYEPGIAIVWLNDAELAVMRGEFEYLRLVHVNPKAERGGWIERMAPHPKPAVSTPVPPPPASVKKAR
ncbi:hypothetical protein [Brevifollis gellanilyticus]|uniref:Lipoprotein n=1 Tax=Brevifollis gellanilyticus TaxID=748831 RepID=A0A512MAK9_9BACT|nr:hypothetical protein [Brevifollis gellanilyticus]GEP43764.1 hypothetical protein BGE01nite_30550 [Brevifollis gellanilyticus]